DCCLLVSRVCHPEAVFWPKDLLFRWHPRTAPPAVNRLHPTRRARLQPCQKEARQRRYHAAAGPRAAKRSACRSARLSFTSQVSPEMPHSIDQLKLSRTLEHLNQLFLTGDFVGLEQLTNRKRLDAAEITRAISAYPDRIGGLNFATIDVVQVRNS